METEKNGIRCASCKSQRKKCSESCVLAPYFPSTDPEKFAIVQRVFGTSHVVKTLKGLEDYERLDAVNSMVYEANARVKDPIHGSTSAVHQLQKQIAELESQLAATQAEVASMASKRDALVSLLVDECHVLNPTQQNDDVILDNVDQLWEPL